ncbi:MAG: amino-acid N-acetyltransferase [Treponemataceae bacterium]
MNKTYLTAKEIAEKWKTSERSVRNYCSLGRVPGAILKGKTWYIPSDITKPPRKNKKKLFENSNFTINSDFNLNTNSDSNFYNSNSPFFAEIPKSKIITGNAEKIRDVIRYFKRFKNAAVVIHVDERVINSSFFSSHISDIALMHEAGLNVLLVPGAKKSIDEVLTKSGFYWQEKDDFRITNEQAIPLIKMAAFDVSNKIMTSLSGHGLTSLIGNWVRSRAKGVIDGLDYGSSGEIEKIDTQSIKTVLNNGFIPILPCIGWSSNGKPYNVSSINLATATAISLKAEKLFFLTPDYSLTPENFTVPIDLPLSPEGCIPALNLEELDIFIKANKRQVNSDKINLYSAHPVIKLLECAKKACNEGVMRSHILNGSIDGSMPCEIFSGLGSGTMIYKSNYGKIRDMQPDDVSRVLGIMRPFIENGILLPRTEQNLSETYKDYIVYELDGGIRACASLIQYWAAATTKCSMTLQAEIAAIAVDETYSNMGIGPKMVSFLIEKAHKLGFESVFVMTTQTSDWFEKLGFKPDSINSIPIKRKALWSEKRGSKVFRLVL